MTHRASSLPHCRYRLIGVCLLLLGLLTAGLDPAARSEGNAAARFSADSTVDVALGRLERELFAAHLKPKQHGGKQHDWAAYSAWGRQLLIQGQATNPPQGDSPSPRLSEHYRCVHCHNLAREDSRLTVQDPDVRAERIRSQVSGDPTRRDGSILSLTPGTTLWGAVNRERFYNGYYAKYHTLRLGDDQAMNPEKLADAVQVCGRYCSSGRFLEPWELDSILAHLWDLELRIKDLDLPEAKLKEVLEGLNSDNVLAAAKARQAIKQSMLRASNATRQELPQRSTEQADVYADEQVVRGEATAGKFLYHSACAGCHGPDLSLPFGRELGTNAPRFHRFVWHGTERDDLYMPFFTKERLSRKQSADIRAYLLSLPRPPTP
jgi:mono/diheme cytochrome c family protein